MQLHDVLRARGMGHVADLLELASERPHFRNEALPAAPPAIPDAPIPGPPLEPPIPLTERAPAPPAAPAPAPAAPPAAPPEEWTGPTREEWGQTREVMGLLNEILTAAPEPAPAPAPAVLAPGEPRPAAPELPPLNVYDPASIEAHINARLEQGIAAGIESRLGAYQPILDGVAEERGQRLLEEGFTALEQPAEQGGLGMKFDHERAAVLYGAFMTANPNLDPNIALRAAAQYRAEDERRMMALGQEAYIAGLTRVGDAPPAPPTPGAPVERVTTPDPRDPDKYEKMAQAWLERRRAPATSAVVG